MLQSAAATVTLASVYFLVIHDTENFHNVKANFACVHLNIFIFCWLLLESIEQGHGKRIPSLKKQTQT